MALTYTSLVTTLGALSVSGVTALTEAPHTLSPSDLPVGFPRLPEGNQSIISFTGASDIDNIEVDYHVVFAPALLNTNGPNQTATLTALDALNAALKAEMASSTEIDAWTMRADIDVVGTTRYWSIICTIEASK